MQKSFTFKSLSSDKHRSNEANIFIHGYSAGHNENDRNNLLECIPESIRNHTNIFAFWKSSHFSNFNQKSKSIIYTSSKLSLPVGAVVTAADRGAHFWLIRKRSEKMGELLLDQLSKYLEDHHKGIETVNLIGHSLGGRLIISSLKNLVARQSHSLTVNDVLLMAAAVAVKPSEANQIRSAIKGRLINAYSKSDRTLLLNADENCIGRNEVDHFENVEIVGFGHSDYWKQLSIVLTQVQFKIATKNQAPEALQIVTTTTDLPPKILDLQRVSTMALNLKTPSDIYQYINDELMRIIQSLNIESNDSALNIAQQNAREILKEQQTILSSQLAALQANAEWKTFTIAVYGETGAGKSTLIETLRILLQEPTKAVNQQAFRELQKKYDLSERSLQHLQQAIEKTDIQLVGLTQQLNATTEHHSRLHSEALESINKLRNLIIERKETASLWQKLIRLFKPIPEEAQFLLAEKQLPIIAAARDSAIEPLRIQQSNTEQEKNTLEQQRKHQAQESESILINLQTLSDGEIIGDGSPDFTRKTQRYDLKLNDHPFALLDVPGIEGHEGLVVSEIEKAVLTSHAVLYVTNQAAPPQTGDAQRKGTLEKIKEHLGAQSEVWTIFNKKITNPKLALINRPLISKDEAESLKGLNEKMREQLGDHYREVLPLSALPAFLASTDHFAPRSQNATRRAKMLADFKPEELLEKTSLRAFLYFLNSKLLEGSEAKITRANLHKTKDALDQTVKALEELKDKFRKLWENLRVDGHSAQVQLQSSFKSLKKRLESAGESEIDYLVSSVRNSMYKRIDADMSNDEFKQAFRDSIDAQQKQLGDRLPIAIATEVERFQKEAEDILARFEAQARELTGIYAKLSSTKFNSKFVLKIKIDNGIKVGGLLLGVAGAIAAAIFPPASLYIIIPALASLIISSYKGLKEFFSSDYKKSQQREAIDSNLRNASSDLRNLLHNSLKTSLADMEEKISLLEQALEAPITQANGLVQLLSQSTYQLTNLSQQIDNTGKP